VRAVHASKVATRNGSVSSTTAARRDPYWDGLWVSGSQAHWSTRDSLQQRNDTDGTRVNKKFLMDQEEAMTILTSSRNRSQRLAFWGVLDSWRTATAQQAAAFTGFDPLDTPTTQMVAASFSLGLIDIGTFPAALTPRPGFDSRSLYRPSDSKSFRRLIAPTLTWPEQLQATAGYDWSAGGQNDRHNVLAAELALRAAEHLPISGVLGEKLSTVDLLAGSGLGKTVNRPDNRRADGVLIRPDGLRIVMELTATASQSLKRKVHRWAKLLSERPLETSGIVIVFVTAPHPNRRKSGRDPHSEVVKVLAEVLHEFPGTGTDSPAARIGIVSWDEWFPGTHLLSKGFFELRCDFALKPEVRGPGKWVSRSLLNEYPFEPWKGFNATAVIQNQGLLGATPFWFRQGEFTYLIGTPAQREGVTIPVPAPQRPERSRGGVFGQPTGAVGKVTLPSRLRIRS
jgi:hypothetical protein